MTQLPSNPKLLSFIVTMQNPVIKEEVDDCLDRAKENLQHIVEKMTSYQSPVRFPSSIIREKLFKFFDNGNNILHVKFEFYGRTGTLSIAEVTPMGLITQFSNIFSFNFLVDY
jgi:hypothetical protein